MGFLVKLLNEGGGGWKALDRSWSFRNGGGRGALEGRRPSKSGRRTSNTSKFMPPDRGILGIRAPHANLDVLASQYHRFSYEYLGWKVNVGVGI